MTRSIALAVFCLLAATWQAWLPPAARAQKMIDRIVVRIEDDIILLSEVRELAAYQQLVDGHAEPYAKLVSELIEQWIVRSEATMARFPAPAESEIDPEVVQIESRFPSPQAYDERLADLGITSQTVRRVVGQQIYLARYLDYKFRPAVQVDDAAIEAYYQQQLTPQLQAKNQPVPPLADVREQIREVLTEQGVNTRAATWFDETKSRLKIEVQPISDLPTETPGASPGNADRVGVQK
jgi:hypothetical protein